MTTASHRHTPPSTFMILDDDHSINYNSSRSTAYCIFSFFVLVFTRHNEWLGVPWEGGGWWRISFNVFVRVWIWYPLSFKLDPATSISHRSPLLRLFRGRGCPHILTYCIESTLGWHIELKWNKRTWNFIWVWLEDFIIAFIKNLFLSCVSLFFYWFWKHNGLVLCVG